MNKRYGSTSGSTSQLMNVHEAAEYLGRWAYSNQIKGTKVGTRGDWRFKEGDLKSITTQLSQFDAVADNSHFVQFYEDDRFLVQSVLRYLKSGDTAIVVAAPEHKDQIERAITTEMSEGAEKTLRGSYICLDARESLSQFMVNGVPNRNLFFNTVGNYISDALKDKRKLRVFGEMVALLWADGNQEAAIQLEELWNELQEEYTFSLFCAYPLHGFKDKSQIDWFEKIEMSHSHVIPSESFTNITDEDEKLRKIALLQQKAMALESEVTKHKKTEALLVESLAALKTSEDFNRKIIENSADCIKVLDKKGHLQSMNLPGCKAFEIEDFSAFAGQDYRDFWKDKDYENSDVAIQTALNGGVGRFQGFCPTAKGTPKWWDVVITPIYSKKGTVDKLLAISRDITSLKELEQRKEDFLSATSHELKTPLTSQKAFIQLLQRELRNSNNEKYTRMVSKISDQTDKLMKLVSDLLDGSKVRGGKLVLQSVPFDLNDCVVSTVEELQTITDTHSLSIHGTISKGVIGDKEKICQVMINLLTNAIKYSPNSNKINVMLSEDSQQATVSVQDFGIGIDQKDQEKIYERFFRVNDTDEKTYPGLGMGLYIAAEIVKQHSGKLEVKSSKGKGSTFSFSIPFK